MTLEDIKNFLDYTYANSGADLSGLTAMQKESLYTVGISQVVAGMQFAARVLKEKGDEKGATIMHQEIMGLSPDLAKILEALNC